MLRWERLLCGQYVLLGALRTDALLLKIGAESWVGGLICRRVGRRDCNGALASNASWFVQKKAPVFALRVVKQQELGSSNATFIAFTLMPHRCAFRALITFFTLHTYIFLRSYYPSTYTQLKHRSLPTRSLSAGMFARSQPAPGVSSAASPSPDAAVRWKCSAAVALCDSSLDIFTQLNDFDDSLYINALALLHTLVRLRTSAHRGTIVTRHPLATPTT